MHVLSVNNTNNYFASFNARNVRTVKLYNGRIARFVTETKDNAEINDENFITFLKTLLCVKDANGKLRLEKVVKTLKKPEGLSKEEIKTYKADAALLCKTFQKEPGVIIDGREINTAFYDSVNFIDTLVQSVKQAKESL